MGSAASVKIGLVVPAGPHRRVREASRAKPRGAMQADYALAFARLLDALDAGEPVWFAAVRGRKRRIAVRLSERLSRRLRATLSRQNLRPTDFASAAIDRRHPPP